MADEIIKELWEIKDSIANDHDYDLDSLTTYLKLRKFTENRQVVNLRAIKKIPKQGLILNRNSTTLHFS